MKTSIHIAILSLAASGVLALAPQAHADIIVLAPTASTTGSFQITNDITFTITTSAIARAFILDEWVTSDENRDWSAFSPGLLVSINAGAPVSQGTGSFADNRTIIAGTLSPNDGFIYVDTAFAVTAGDTVTLKAATYSLAAVAGFNTLANQAFTGNMFIGDTNVNKISDTVPAGAVPEPSTWTMLLNALFAGSTLTLEWLETAGVRYDLKESSTLLAWSTSAVTPTVSADQTGVPTGYKRMRATIPVPLPNSPAANKFFRVEATAAP